MNIMVMKIFISNEVGINAITNICRQECNFQHFFLGNEYKKNF